MEPVGSQFLYFKKLFAEGDFFSAGATGFVFELDIEFFPQPLDSFPKFKVFHLHDEGKAVAAFTGTEAFKKAAVGVDVKGGCFFLSKGAQALKRATGTLELYVGRNNVNKVDLLLDRFDGSLSDLGHWRALEQSVEGGFCLWPEMMIRSQLNETPVGVGSRFFATIDTLVGTSEREYNIRALRESIVS